MRTTLSPAERAVLLRDDEAGRELAEQMVAEAAAAEPQVHAAAQIRHGAAVVFSKSLGLFLGLAALDEARVWVAFAESRAEAEAKVLRALGRSEAA